MPSLADRQLAAWQALAEDWETYADGRVRRCTACSASVYLITDAAGRPFQYGPDGLLALTVLHLRACHADMDPDKAL